MKKYIVSESQAQRIIKEALTDPSLMQMVGEKTDRNAYPEPVQPSILDDENKEIKAEEPEVDLKSLPKPPEIKEAWKLLQHASSLLIKGAPKLQDESLTKEVQKMAQDINQLIISTNAKLNVNESDLSI